MQKTQISRRYGDRLVKTKFTKLIYFDTLFGKESALINVWARDEGEAKKKFLRLQRQKNNMDEVKNV